MEVGNLEASSQLLKRKYDLHNAPEVDNAVRRSEARTGEHLSQNPLDRIHIYLNRFREITDRDDPQQREQGIDAIKRLLHAKFIIKPEDIPESYWENKRRILRERGQEADLELIDWEEQKKQESETIISDQISSMDKWIDYLSSPDAKYPDALKYWTIRSVLNLSDYDKEKKQFPQRTKSTIKPFPDLNREALAYVIDAIDKKYNGEDASSVNEESDSEFEKFLQGENFGKLYAFANEKVTPANEHELVNTIGHWVKYNQGSDYLPLVTSLQGHGTGWCTAGESTAQSQLQGGDFYVYYSNDRDMKPTVPRVAIRMEGGRIAEVRGIASEQNLDPYIAPIVEQKLEEFPDGEEYQKKVADMKYLTEIDHKVQRGERLDATDLIFLYEVDYPIQGFGYSRDPRIEELRSGRNLEEDILVVFNCEPSQIAHNVDDLRVDTKAYIGPLVTGIFDKLREYNIEHSYTSFPERKILRQQIEIGGKTKEQLQAELTESGINVSPYALDLMNNPDFNTLHEVQKLDTVRLRVDDLKIPRYPTTEQIYRKAHELGLELCPAEVGPQMRLQQRNQIVDDYYWIGMKQIVDTNGNPGIFELFRDEDGLKLNGNIVKSSKEWNPDVDCVFCLRKSENLNS